MAWTASTASADAQSRFRLKLERAPQVGAQSALGLEPDSFKWKPVEATVTLQTFEARPFSSGSGETA
jgi:hypothetical protein